MVMGMDLVEETVIYAIRSYSFFGMATMYSETEFVNGLME